ncbi:MAG: LysM peptidoglycan-binding domain-containing M23 family metallopeptidase [Chloroflexota bacterium]|nr:LysM peptidoglycan-binding domain-containing M23 family metallopeptidase [Chloroflexota bacterium]
MHTRRHSDDNPGTMPRPRATAWYTQKRRSIDPVYRAKLAQRLATALLLLFALGLFLVSPSPANAQDETVSRYEVQSGDTLSAIAQEFGSTVHAIAAANLLADPDEIFAGQWLVIPPANAPLLRVEVQPGDTLGRIARRFRTSPEMLQEINGMPSQARLWIGQDLLVPADPGGPSPALPDSPIQRIVVWPEKATQGSAVLIQVETSDPISLTMTLGDQIVPLRRTQDGAHWGLVAIHALHEPGYARLDLSWQGEDDLEQTGGMQWPIEVVEGGYPTYDIVLPPSKGGLLQPDLVRAEAEKLAAIWSLPETEPVWQRKFLRPIGDQYVTSAPYGQRRSYNGGPVSGFHSGQDFAAPEGAAVTAAGPGTVVLAEPLTVRGNAVIIDHGGGVYTGYWHLFDIAVVAGQIVQPGDLLGHVGTTGLSTGNHLHWELRLHGFAINPLQWTTTSFR